MFKKDMTPLSKGGKLDKHQGKGSKQGQLPSSRSALNTVTGGSPVDRSMNGYSKATPNLDQSSAATPGILGGRPPF